MSISRVRKLAYDPAKTAIARAARNRKEKQQAIASTPPSLDAIDIREGFLKAVEDYGVNERGEPIVLDGWTRSFYRLVADIRAAEVLVTGCAQSGKTLSVTSFVCYVAIVLKLNTLYSYALERTLNRLVPRQFRPIIKSWLRANNIQLKRYDGVQSNTLFQVGRANASFTYVTRTASSGGAAAAGGQVIGETADILFLEERSQYPPGSTAPLYRRLDASKLPTHPVRQLGTPGNGNGIESEIENADYYFYPHCLCSTCDKEIVLNPKGCLLKPTRRELPTGEIKEVYLSESGRPVEWFCHDPNNAVETAYFGCPHCEAEIPEGDRTDRAYFRCLYTGVLLDEFLDSL